MEIEDVVLKFALANAVEHGGHADEKAVLGKVLASRPELRDRVKEVIGLVKKTVREVNSWDLQKQKSELSRFGGLKKTETRRGGLPELPVSGKVVLRFAVSPNGPLHLGHCRAAVLNDEYRKRYSGELILRFDDTDPKNPGKTPIREAYSWIEEDLKWLGVEISRIERASARLKRYREVFQKVIEIGGGYMCTCPPEEWSRKVRTQRKSCPCRSRTLEENLELWHSMISGEFSEGEIVGRVKTDLHNPDPAVIDWVAFRLVDEPEHPFSGEKLWPTLDFASAVDDKDFGVTHIIRGKDLAISEKRQKYLYRILGWEYPFVKVFGRLKAEGQELSTSRVRKLIEKGVYSGFDDVRLLFLRALRRRGITPEAVRNYMIRCGFTESDAKLDLKILYSENRKIIDPVAKRYFFVSEPVEIELDGIPVETVEAPLLPDKSKFRTIPVTRKIFVEKTDFEKFSGTEVRLMHLCNVVLSKTPRVSSLEVKEIPKIHWVPENSVEIGVIMQDGRITGLAEPGINDVKSDEICQFERFGFVRCERKGLFYFAHK
ncbi:MAG: glutamate--tRNA ligase [Candidatus Micrarchaeota archaeon]|nr:glutamate--tRNA ligase [Candidatus Micrarchaeota archaeon]